MTTSRATRGVVLAFASVAIAFAPLSRADASAQDPTDGLGLWLDAGADFDGDEVADVLVGDRGFPARHAPCAWMLSGLDGALLDRLVLRPEDVELGGCCLVSDLDGDGRTDIVLAAIDGARRSICRAHSSRTHAVLWTSAPFAIGSGWVRLQRIGDVDGDGLADLARWRPGAPPDAVLREEVEVLSAADGRRLATMLFDIPPVRWRRDYEIADAGDVDGDGLPEVVFTTPSMYETADLGSIGLYSIARHSSLWTYLLSEEMGWWGTGVAGNFDFDGDGQLDVAIASGGGGDRLVDRRVVFDSGRLNVLRAHDGTALTTIVARGLGEGWDFGKELAVLEDLDGDHRPDFACGYPQYFLNGGVLVLGTAGSLPGLISGVDPDWHWGGHVRAAGDLDCDGSTDVVVSCSQAGGHFGGAVRAVNTRNRRFLWTRSEPDLSSEARARGLDVRWADGRR